jgi:hypothetical protein
MGEVKFRNPGRRAKPIKSDPGMSTGPSGGGTVEYN